MSTPHRAPGGRPQEEAPRRLDPDPPEPRGPRSPGGEGDVAEEGESLWILALGPTIWMGHFLASYVLAAVWCAKVAGRTGALGPVRLWIAGFTVVALAGIAATFVAGMRRHRSGTAGAPHRADTPEDRHRFLGFATALLSGLSAVAVVYVALAALFFETCL